MGNIFSTKVGCIVAAVLPRMKPAFKVAASSPRRGIRKPYGVLVDEDTIPPGNPWQKYRLKLLPKRINGKWYKAGSWVYRRWMPSPGGGYWKYGDDFDFMRGR
jgi:hypothetical protein